MVFKFSIILKYLITKITLDLFIMILSKMLFNFFKFLGNITISTKMWQKSHVLPGRCFTLNAKQKVSVRTPFHCVIVFTLLTCKILLQSKLYRTSFLNGLQILHYSQISNYKNHTWSFQHDFEQTVILTSLDF